MPVKIIENLTTESLPYFPMLGVGKTNRTITKHFTNLHLYLDRDKLALLTWLLYECAADNSIEYSHQLVLRYSAAISAAEKQYNTKANLNVSVKKIRDAFRGLILGGYILPTFDKSIFLLNPMLSYRTEYVSKKEYKKCCDVYQDVMVEGEFAGINWFTSEYRKLVNSKIKSKKNVSKGI